jgi:hypothetical protein
MSELNYTVNAEELEKDFEPVPAAEYIAVIEDSDYVDNKNNTGKNLKLTYQIIEGRMKGRKIFNNLNLENPSQQAAQIARRTLNSIGVAVGLINIKDSTQLHDTPMRIKVTVKDDPIYGKRNQITKHTALKQSETKDVAAPVTDNNSTQEATAAAPDNGQKKEHPWET